MFYQEGFADEESLNSAILTLVGEVDELYEDVGRLQDSWQEAFGVPSPDQMDPHNQTLGRYGDFIWEALTTSVDQDDALLRFLEEGVERDVTGVGTADDDDFFMISPIIEEAEEDFEARSEENLEQDTRDEPTEQGNEERVGLQPEGVASSTNDCATSDREFNDCEDRPIQRSRSLRNRLICEGASHVPPTAIIVKKETRPESEGAASSINADRRLPNSRLPMAVGRGKARCRGICPKGKKDPNNGTQSERASSANDASVNEDCPVTVQSLPDDVAGDRGADQTDRDGVRSQPTHVEEIIPDLLLDYSTFKPRSSNTHLPLQRWLKRSTSTSGLQEKSGNNSSSEEFVGTDVNHTNQTPNQMRPWLESNASALIGTSDTDNSHSSNFTQPTIPDKSVYLQTLFNEQIDSVCEDIEEMRWFAISRDSAANQHLVDALRSLKKAKSEAQKDTFRLWEDVEFESLTPESNQRAQNRLRGNAIVTGVPTAPNENVLGIIKRIGYALGRPVDDVYVKEAFRLNKTDPLSPIIVKFRHALVKDMLVKASSTSELYSNELDIRVGERSLVCIQDQLTPFNINLFEKAKVMKDRGFIDLWVARGKIWLKKHGSNTCELNSIAQLLVLLKEFKYHVI